MASPAHVARETFVLTDDWLEVRGNCERDVVCFHRCSIEMPGRAVWIRRKYKAVRAQLAGDAPALQYVLMALWSRRRITFTARLRGEQAGRAYQLIQIGISEMRRASAIKE